jgi:hypothetical protein
MKVLADPTPDQGGRDVSVAPFLLNLVQHAQHNAFLASKAVVYVWNVIATHFNVADAPYRVRP